MGPAQGSGSCQCCLSLSLILRSAMVSSAGAGFSSFSSSMRSDARAFLRMAALAFPSLRRCVRMRRVRGRRALSWGPSAGSGGWVPAPYRVRGRLFAGTTAVGVGTTDELGSRCIPALLGRATPLPWVPAFAGTTGELSSACAPTSLGRDTPRPWVPAFAGTTGELSSACAPTSLGRATPLPWVPAFAGTTIELSGFPSACAGTTYESPSPQPSPVEGEGVWEPGSGRTRGSAPTAGESPSPQPSPAKGEGVVEGAGVWEGCSSRTMCTMSSLAAAILWWVLKPSVLSCITSSRNSMMVPASAVWARMSLAMRNSSIPESTVRKSRVRVAGAFRVTSTRVLSSAEQGSAWLGRPLMEWPHGTPLYLAMNSAASFDPYFTSCLAASILWQSSAPSILPVMTSVKKSMMSAAVAGLFADDVGDSGRLALRGCFYCVRVSRHVF